MAVQTAIPRDVAGVTARAIPVATPSIRPHQMYAAAALGRARGVTQRHAPAVVYDDMQAVELGRGDVSPVSFRISHWRFLPRQLVELSAFAGARYITNSRALGCRPFRLKRLPHQKLVNAVSDRLHFSNVLSKPCSLAGSNNASKGLQGRGYLTQALGRFSQGSAPND